MPTVAFPHDTSGDEFGHVAQYHRTTLVDGVRRPYLDGLQWPGVATVANLPATAVPTGRLIDGLPMGLQVIGPYLEDRTPLRFAQLAEQESAATCRRRRSVGKSLEPATTDLKQRPYWWDTVATAAVETPTLQPMWMSP